MGRNDTFLEIFCVSYSKSRVFYRPELNRQNRVLYKVSDGLQNIFLLRVLRGWRKLTNARRFALWRAPMVVTYNIKLFRTGADRRNGILMSLLLLVAETIRQTNILITSLISLRSTRQPVDQQCELDNARKTTDDENPDEQKSSILLINCEKRVNETLNKDHESNVCLNPPPLIENRISNIPDITDNKTSTNRNTSTKTERHSNQRENSITEKSKKLAFVISNSMIKNVGEYLLTSSLNRKYIVKVRPFSSTKTSDMEYYVTPKNRDFHSDIYILHVGTNDLTLDDKPEQFTEHIANIAKSLKKKIAQL